MTEFRRKVSDLEYKNELLESNFTDVNVIIKFKVQTSNKQYSDKISKLITENTKLSSEKQQLQNQIKAIKRDENLIMELQSEIQNKDLLIDELK